MNKPKLVSDPKYVTAEWLTLVLRNNGYDADVESFEYSEIGTGQMARCFRFSMSIAGDLKTPRSLIGKFSSADLPTKEMAASNGAYACEIGFYQGLAPKIELATADCYFADINSTGDDFSLLIEDLSPAIQGDQLRGCEIAVAEQAVDQLALLHSQTWDQAPEAHAWLHTHRTILEQIAERLKLLTPEFLRRLGKNLDPDETELIEKLAQNYDKLIPIIELQSRAIIHNDFRADNLLINNKLATPSVTVVDWQTATFGSPAQDVAYFIGTSLSAELRQQTEIQLLRRYHETLKARGINSFSWADCQAGYQLGCFSGLTTAIAAAALVVETERGNELFTTMAKRACKQAIDHGADQLL